MSTRLRPAAAALAALLAGTALAACAGIPTSGSPEDIRQVAEQTDATAPRGPEPGQQPDQIVREFIHAEALTEFDTAGESYVVARQFLTAAAQRTWPADSGVTEVVVLADDFSVTTAPDRPGTVIVTGTQVGTLATDRSYRPVDAVEYEAALHLETVDDQWRISAPPPYVLMTRSDFSAAFRPRTVYFLDFSGRVVVPDIRYVPNSASPDLVAGRLMDLLLRGPSASIAGGARTALGADAALASNVHIDASGVAHVDLTGVDVSTATARQALAAQIVWTLDPDVQQIAISVNGLPLAQAGKPEPGQPGAAPGVSPGVSSGISSGVSPGPDGDGPVVDSLTNASVANFNPDAVPGSAQAVSDAYYIDGGAIVRLSDSAPLWGSVGTGSVTVTSAALSAASGALAAVADDGDGGAQLLVGRPFDFEPTATVLKADTLTTPSFGRAGLAAWTVQNGATNPEVYEISMASGTPTWSPVASTELARLGPVTALALSPDGVRVAIVADGRLYMGVRQVAGAGALVGAGDAAADSDQGADQQRRWELTGLRMVRADLHDVGPVTWDDSLSLLVGARVVGSAHRTVFEVSVDGLGLEPVTTARAFGEVFGDVDAIAASASGGPLLISFDRRIWELQGSRAAGRWVPPGGGNWMQGSAPFYPR